MRYKSFRGKKGGGLFEYHDFHSKPGFGFVWICKFYFWSIDASRASIKYALFKRLHFNIYLRAFRHFIFYHFFNAYFTTSMSTISITLKNISIIYVNAILIFLFSFSCKITWLSFSNVSFRKNQVFLMMITRARKL